MTQEQLKLIENELKKFEEWFRSVGNSPLSKYESAIVKTYIAAVILSKFKTSLFDQK